MGQAKARCGYRPESLELNNSPSKLTKQEIDQDPQSYVSDLAVFWENFPY